MKRKSNIVNIIIILLWGLNAYAVTPRYGELLCKQPGYICQKSQRSDSWGSLFPNPKRRVIAKQVNRMNEFLKPDVTLAIPEQLKDDEHLNLIDYAPFPKVSHLANEEFMLIDKSKQAWAAYNDQGALLRWGAISSGRLLCDASHQSCETPSGSFRAQHKGGKNCFSKSYPKLVNGQRGGAAMPYCIYFYKGFTIHASQELPGYPSSHGCVNLFWDDARWLNEQFIRTSEKKQKGTLIVIQ